MAQLVATGSGGVLYQGIDVSPFSAETFDLKAWVNAALTLPDSSKSVQQTASNASGTDDIAEPFATSIEDAGRSGDEVRDSVVSTTSGDPVGRQSTYTNQPIRTSSFTDDPKTPDTTSIDQLSSTLVLKLQLYSQEVTNRLDLLSDDTVRSIPRISHDLDSVLKEASNLRQILSSAKLEFATASGQNPAFSDLVRLDSVRTRMEKTRQALKEAENWSTLAPEMENIFAEGDFLRAAIRLEEAQRSLGLLASAPDYEDRKILIGNIKKRLEDSIAPSLVAALNEHDAEATKRIYSIYVRLGRGEQFLEAYYQARKEPVRRLWQRYDADPSIKAAEGRGERDFADWLGPFYEEVFLVLHKESNWGLYIFPNADEVTRSLVTNVFRALDPSLGKRMSDVVGRLRDGSFPVIIKAYQKTVAFGQKVERLFETTVEDPKGDSSQSLANVGIASQSDTSVWGHVLFDAFLPFQQDYGNHEFKYLSYLANLTLPSAKKADNVEIARLMAESVPKVFAHADAAMVRCRQFTLGYGLVGLVDCLNQYVTYVIDKYIGLLAAIRETSGSGAEGGDVDEEEDDYDLGGGVGGRQEWGHFQAGIRVLGMCPAMKKKLVGLPGGLRKLVASVRNRLDEGRDWREPVDGKDGGDECLASWSLLRLSTLNSYKLHMLLDALDQESSSQPTTPKALDFGDALTGTGTTFKAALDRLAAFTMRTQRLVYDAILETVNKHLSTLPNLQIWQSAPPTTSGPFNLEVPQFSLSPQSYATFIGEHLLTLPQHLELHAGDDALGFSLHTLPYLTAADFRHLELEGDTTITETTTLAPEDVLNLWITSIARGAMNSFADAILRIAKLSAHGARQLDTDVGYIVNVFSAMDIEPLEKLRDLMGLVEAGSEELDRVWKERRKGGKGGDADVVRRVAVMRGIVLTP